jgi:triosephosphate isomerase
MRSLIAGNWKMHGTAPQLREIEAIATAVQSMPPVADILVCPPFGETDGQRRAGRALSVCASQIAGSVPDGMAEGGNAIGYEPLWAIGTGHTPTVGQVAEVHAHIRQCLVARFGSQGKDIRILYGGSVNPANAHEFLSVPEVGGALIGMSSPRIRASKMMT